MTETLKKFATWNDRNTFKLGESTIIPHFDGETCWEKSHPTFISKKRKVILTCPRKVGHSSIRYYFFNKMKCLMMIGYGLKTNIEIQNHG